MTSRLKKKSTVVITSLALMSLVTLAGCYVTNLGFPMNLRFAIFTGYPYATSNEQTSVEDRSTATKTAQSVKLSADFARTATGSKSATNLKRSKKSNLPSLKKGSVVTNFDYEVDNLTGEGTGSGVARVKFTGRKGGTWCAKFSAKIESFGAKITGTYKTTGGNGRVGQYKIKKGTFTGGVDFEQGNKLTLNMDGKASKLSKKARKKFKRLPKACKEIQKP